MRGFGLIELLIALLIASIGLLAGMKWHLLTVREQQEVLLQALATQEVQNMYERLIVDDDWAREISLWQQNVAKTLPLGQGSVVMNDNKAEIIVAWDGVRSGSANSNLKGIYYE